eukprot:jgi/Tetstr1/463159/TSEL_008093.t1
MLLLRAFRLVRHNAWAAAAWPTGYDVLYSRIDSLARQVVGPQGLDRCLRFRAEHAQRQYDDWNGVSINVTAFEWMAVMGHLAFQAKLSGKPECNIHHHFLVTVTWSLQLWKLCMRKKISQRACSITNASIIAWIMTAHTTLIAVDDNFMLGGAGSLSVPLHS